MRCNIILVIILLMSVKVQGQSEEEVPEEYAISDSMLWEMAKGLDIHTSKDGLKKAFIYNHSWPLNDWEELKELPAFLEDFEFDNKFYFYCERNPMGVYESLRKVIFDEVFNQEVLHAIMNGDNEAYDKKYNPEELRKNSEYVFMKDYADFEYQEYSMRDLARLRLKELDVFGRYH